MCHRAAPATVRWHSTPQQVASPCSGVSEAKAAAWATSGRGSASSGRRDASSATAERTLVCARSWLVCAVECAPKVVTASAGVRFPFKAEWRRTRSVKVIAFYLIKR